jgi:hypothetical protein
MSQAYPIYQTLWESMDGILFNKALALAKDLAAELGVPPQELIAILKQEERSKFHLIPDDEATYQCQALVQRGRINMRCRNPTLNSTSVCGSHNHESRGLVKSVLPELKRVSVDGSIYFTDNTAVYDIDGSKCGTLVGDGTAIKIFQIVEDS